MKLINDTIGTQKKDLKVFLELLNGYGAENHNPFVVDASQTLLDVFFGEANQMSDFEQWSKGQIKFK